MHAARSRSTLSALLLVGLAEGLACGGERTDRGTPIDAGTNSPDVTTQLDSSAPLDPPLRVLFIGNSYTYVNDLPGLLRTISETAGVPPKIETDEVTAGGANLEEHFVTGTARARIALGTWTHVVLQGQSVEPLLWPESFVRYATYFGDDAVKVNARPTFYVTWARIAGDPLYQESFTGGSPDAMQDGLTKAYSDVAATFPTALVVKVGEAFRASLAARPTLRLHADDGSHPSIAGSYLAASTFYVALTGHAVPEAATVPSGVSTDDASYLRTIAASTR
jgi:hypothetical protein